ncbi:hypothetical protein KXX58_005561 [Aspergillus fumigatus]|nr:hypothetical protein KXX58_005561 [Aspergillus fumigatus]KAH2870896.1 hypothetical protein KXV67_002777 [Aspergillus fumigatus]KAH3349025.1 hypothetical protein KXW44_008103 [Aspergillus fumigatus]
MIDTKPQEWPMSTRMLEMRLMHHYLTKTYHTLHQGKIDATHFQTVVPEMATSHPFLLDSLLALTALHLAFLNPADKRPWMEAALKYQNQACSVFSRVLVDISPENCGPAFICAVFILLCATAYPCVAGDTHPFDPLAQVLETRRLLVGCAFLYHHLHRHPGQLKEWLRFPNDVKREENVTSQGTWNTKLVPLRSALLDSLRQVAAVMNDASEPHRAAYQETWDFLHDTISLWPLGGPRGGIISWPVHIGEDYIALLKQGDWIARILFLHYGVGMHLLSDKWTFLQSGPKPSLGYDRQSISTASSLRRVATAVVSPSEDGLSQAEDPHCLKRSGEDQICTERTTSTSTRGFLNYIKRIDRPRESHARETPKLISCPAHATAHVWGRYGGLFVQMTSNSNLCVYPFAVSQYSRLISQITGLRSESGLGGIVMQGPKSPRTLQDVEKQPLLQSSPSNTPVGLSDSSQSVTRRPNRATTMSGHLRAAFFVALLLLVLVVHVPKVLTSPLGLTYRNPNGGNHQGHHVKDGRRGAVASESAICSRHGIDILELGGNAADALVATVLCVGVIGMYHSGIGGGGFMLVRAPNGSFEFIDFRETAPAAAFEEMFNNSTHASTIGGLASGVPGELRGLEYLHKKYGSLPWSVLVQPAIKTAREGFPVGQDLVKYMKSAVGDGIDFLVENPTWALDFAPNGTRLGLGDTMTRRRYADTLETIANKGPAAFYSGPIAETMINALQAANGTMTMEDLRNYTVAIRNVSQIDYRGYQITSTSAPSSGTVALSILKILSTYDGFFAPGNVNLSTHRLDEAMRFGYGERTNLGDPLFVAGLDEFEENMLKQSTIDEIRRKISDYRTQNVSAYNPQGIESLNECEYPADHTGLAISLVTTINTLFGSQLMVPETGIIMNNEMDDFSVPGKSNSFGYVPSKANYIRPGKRPLSSITPAIVTRPDGNLFFLAGSAGGSRIITATVQNIIRVIDQGLTAAQALAQPRLHDQLIPNQVSFEYTYDNSTVDFMKSRGHNVTWVAPGQSTAQAIRVLPNGTFDAAGEPRQLDSGGFSI